MPIYTYGEKISQIQIAGLQPCDDLTGNDPVSLLTFWKGTKYRLEI